MPHHPIDSRKIAAINDLLRKTGMAHYHVSEGILALPPEEREVIFAKVRDYDGFCADTDPRQTAVKEELASLTASIRAHGLLNPLHVQKGRKGVYQVIAGQRRLLALLALAEEGHLAPDAPVACLLLAKDNDPGEIGLAENTVRADMHPADKALAFRRLAERGMTPAEIGFRFGMGESTALRHLKLARVAPEVFAAYRDGRLTLDEAQAFALSDDHAAQTALLESLLAGQRSLRSPAAIRRALTEGELSCDDKLARFVTLDAYIAAGGAVRRDLFDDRSEGTIIDAALLHQLANDKADAAIAAALEEGWKWAEFLDHMDYAAESAFRRAEQTPLPLDDETQARLDALCAERTAIEEQYADTELDGHPDQEAITERWQSLDEEIQAIERQAEGWSPDTKARAGVLFMLTYDGTLKRSEGLIRKEDDPASQDETPKRGARAKAGLSAGLRRDLTAHRTAGLRAEVMNHPNIALAAIGHRLALSLLYPCGEAYGVGSCLTLRVESRRLPDEVTEASAACARIEKWRAAWELPPAKELFAWCLAQPQDALLDLLALLTAHLVDGVDDGVRDAKHAHADHLAAAVNLTMTDWFRPTAENYFSRITRERILAAWPEMTGAPAGGDIGKLTKRDLSERAERAVIGTGWLPEPLRTPKEEASAAA